MSLKLLKILISINFPLDLLILKTIYAQFCGGRDIYECEDVIDNLKKNKVYSILDYSIEGSVTENDFENSMNKCLNILSDCKSKNLSKFIVFKPSAVGRFSLYKKVSSKLDLDAEEENEWNRVENRFNKICLEASKTNIMVLVDAEESWIQNGIDELVYNMMKTYNKNKAIVFNTLQAYRRDRFIGSHNEKSNLLSTELLKKYKIKTDDDRIWFSQLYGMSDNISFSLANNGYNVAKYLPFGPVKEVMPYLMRRLDENSSISFQTNRELKLIEKEINRRKK